MLRTVATARAARRRHNQDIHTLLRLLSHASPVARVEEAPMAGLLALTRHRAVALVAAGVVAGAAGGVVISQLGTAGAASPSPTPSPGDRDGFGQPPAPGLRGGHDGKGLLGALGGGRVLHGEATVEKPGGGTTVVHFQSGVISAIGGSTVTVKSTDGFTSTFTVNGTTRISLNGTDGTLSKLAKNDKVRVMGVVNGSSTVAKLVFDGVPGPGMFGRGPGHGSARRMAPGEAPGKAG